MKALFGPLASNLYFQLFYYSFFILLGSYLLSKLIPFLFFRIVKPITKKTKTDLDDKLTEALYPFARRIIIYGGLYAIFLNFQNYFSLFDAYSFQRKVIDFRYFNDLVSFFEAVFFIYLITITLFFSFKASDIFFEWYEQRISGDEIDKLKKSAFFLIKKLSRIAIFIIFAAYALEHFGVDIKALLVSFGVSSLAIAFAAQETLSNMIAGFIIMIDRPFSLGDAIKLPTGEIGTVHEIGFRSSKILDQENNVVIISNAELLRSRVINFSSPEKKYIFYIEASIKFYEFKSTLETCSQVISKAEDENLKFDFIKSELVSASPDNYVFRFFFTAEFTSDIRQIKSHIFEKFVRELRNLTTEVSFKQNVINLKVL